MSGDGKSFEAHLREDRRGAILRILLDQAGYGANDGVLQIALERVGHRVSIDAIRADVAWLSEQGLASYVEERTCWVASISQRGEDVAAGRAKVPGVRRPRPEA